VPATAQGHVRGYRWQLLVVDARRDAHFGSRRRQRESPRDRLDCLGHRAAVIRVVARRCDVDRTTAPSRRAQQACHNERPGTAQEVKSTPSRRPCGFLATSDHHHYLRREIEVDPNCTVLLARNRRSGETLEPSPLDYSSSRYLFALSSLLV